MTEYPSDKLKAITTKVLMLITILATFYSLKSFAVDAPRADAVKLSSADSPHENTEKEKTFDELHFVHIEQIKKAVAENSEKIKSFGANFESIERFDVFYPSSSNVEIHEQKKGSFVYKGKSRFVLESHSRIFSKNKQEISSEKSRVVCDGKTLWKITKISDSGGTKTNYDMIDLEKFRDKRGDDRLMRLLEDYFFKRISLPTSFLTISRYHQGNPLIEEDDEWYLSDDSGNLTIKFEVLSPFLEMGREFVEIYVNKNFIAWKMETFILKEGKKKPHLSFETKDIKLNFDVSDNLFCPNEEGRGKYRDITDLLLKDN